MPTTTPTRCPDCSTVLESDDRFPTWCHACEWNLVPAGPAPAPNPKRRRRAARAQARDERRKQLVRYRVEQLYQSLERGDSAVQDRSWIAAAALAGLVHLVTLTVLLGSLWLVVLSSTLPLRVLGGFGLLLALLVRPRLGRIRPDHTFLTRTQAPALYALADRVAAAVGARPVDFIQVTDEFNASFGRHGLRRRSVLSIGLPFWAVLTAPQRVALLGHEFGHDVNGDHRRGLWLHSALTALQEWHLLAREGGSRSGDSLVDLAQALLVLPRQLLLTLTERLLSLLDRLSVRSGQGAEYLADQLAATVASPAAARNMLGTLLLGPSVESAVVRARSRSQRGPGGPATADLWTELSTLTDSLTPRERERRLRLSAREFGAVDVTHPPTHLRIQLLLARPVEPSPVPFDQADQDRVEAELAPARDRVGRDLLTG
ncbi:M48 family metallopeptidase [Kitasatospora sp. NBC_00070]|uniref:M48 family metallopeptidase n=1 Tax=Kitasatospora sp. NBC_00070 TaxID=2975962 RepID=UPI00324EC21E